MSSVELEKQKLKGRIEGFIFEKLKEGIYKTSRFAPSKLLTHNRFDLGLKLAYLLYRKDLPSLAREIYYHDIRSQTLSAFKEHGNHEKYSFNIYIDHFTKTFADIEENGFDESKTLVPLSSNGTILNAAHRVASAIYLNKEVTCVSTKLDEICPNYQYFADRNTPEDILDIGAITFSQYAESTYLAFLWPSGRKYYNKTEILFPNVVYRKEIKLTSQGALNLLIELYKHMDWLGENENNFPGAHKKLTECFTDFEGFTVVLFQAENIERVRKIKKHIRDINKIGFSSVHITDTIDEVKRIAHLIFNRNGVHFLNYGNPHKFESTLKIVNCLNSLDRDTLKKFVLSGSMTLSVYGIREANDVDYFSNENLPPTGAHLNVESHDSQLFHHKLDKSSLIYDPKYHFQYLNIKFISFEQVYRFKKNRNEEKDRNDCRLMSSLIEKDDLGFFLFKVKQSVFYKKLVIKDRCRTYTINLLKIAGIHDIVRKMYQKLKKVK